MKRNKPKRRRSLKLPGKDDPRMINVDHIETRRSLKMRRATLLKRLFQGMVLVSAAVMTLVMLHHAFRTAILQNDHFTLNHILYETDGRLNRGESLAAAGVREGVNLLELDLVAVRERLEALPQVETAEVGKILPDRLEIRLSERRPIAWIVCHAAGLRAHSPGSGILVDERGRLFQSRHLGPETVGLPSLEVIDATGLAPGQNLEDPLARDALALLAGIFRRDDPTDPLIEAVSIVNGYTLELRTRSGQRARLSTATPVEDFMRFRLILEEFRSRGLEIDSANLLPRRNAAVRLASSEPRPPRARMLAPPANPAPAPLSPEGRRSRDLQAILNRS